MLSAESLRQIDIGLVRYPVDQRRSVIMGALRIAQTEEGWSAPGAIAFVADYIGVTPAQAYEATTFYNMHNLESVGKYKLAVCIGLPCVLRDGMDIGEYLKRKLGIGYGETTPGGELTLAEGECMGARGNAPVMLINNHSVCSFMTEEVVRKKLAEPK